MGEKRRIFPAVEFQIVYVAAPPSGSRGLVQRLPPRSTAWERGESPPGGEAGQTPPQPGDQAEHRRCVTLAACTADARNTARHGTSVLSLPLNSSSPV